MNFAFAKSEVLRTIRNKRYMMFAVAVPVIFVLMFGGTSSKVGGIDAAPFYMVSMATFGAMSAVFSRGSSVAVDRSIGWNRQLRLTALTGPQYVIGKLLTGAVVAIPSVVLVFVLSGLVHGVNLSAARWVEVALAIVVTLIPIGVFGVAVGYLAKPDSMQAVGGAMYMLLSILGGIWYPITGLPTWLQDVAKALPTTWSAQAGRDVLAGSWIGWTGTLVLIAWTVGLVLLVGRGYKRDTYRV